MNKVFIPAVALLAVVAGPARSSDSAKTGMDFLRLPLSARGSAAGSYGDHDPFAVVRNPGLLALQPRRWEAGVSNQMLFAGEENAWGAVASWAGATSPNGSLGLSVVASGLSSEAITDLDIFGEPTGASVSSSALRIGGVVGYQWEFVSLGVGAGTASESYTGVPGEAVAGPSSFLLDVGAVFRFGALDLGGAFLTRGGDAAGEITAGAAYRLGGVVKGSIGGEVSLPGGGLGGPVAAGGVTWNALSMLDVRMGVNAPTGVAGAGGMSGRAGFTVRYRDFALDYALGLPLGDGPGLSHLIGLGWSGGAVRSPGMTPGRWARGQRISVDQGGSTIAVAAFDPQAVSASDAAVVSDLLRSALVKEGAFKVVEKANMDKLLNEQAFQQTGCTTSECAVKLGKILNVKYLVVGTFSKSMGEFLVGMRVVEIETSRIVYSDEAVGSNLSDIRNGVNLLASRLSRAVR